jgi:hypothetical protein
MAFINYMINLNMLVTKEGNFHFPIEKIVFLAGLENKVEYAIARSTIIDKLNLPLSAKYRYRIIVGALSNAPRAAATRKMCNS